MNPSAPLRPASASLYALCAAALLAGGCKPKGPPVPPEAPAVVQSVVLEPEAVRDRIELDGTVQPNQQVQLVARVPGALQSIRFQDGMPVRKGQVLFTIEDSTYQEQVKLNEARLLQAESEYERQRKLMAENATAQASLDNALSNLQQAQANLRLARINLAYTEVRAPFDGVMSRRAVDVGNLVGATGPTVLGTLMQVAPAYVIAAVSEREALRLRATHGAGKPDRKKRLGAPATATLQGQTEPADTGAVDFVDHVVNPGTGSVQVRARFDNAEGRLLPGFYARLKVDLGRERQALVLKKVWLLNDQEGSYVMTVGADQVARRTNVKVSPIAGERVEVLEGLKGGEALIVEGHTRVKPGQAVKVQAAAKGQAAAGSTR